MVAGTLPKFDWMIQEELTFGRLPLKLPPAPFAPAIIGACQGSSARLLQARSYEQLKSIFDIDYDPT